MALFIINLKLLIYYKYLRHPWYLLLELISSRSSITICILRRTQTTANKWINKQQTNKKKIKGCTLIMTQFLLDLKKSLSAIIISAHHEFLHRHVLILTFKLHVPFCLTATEIFSEFKYHLGIRKRCLVLMLIYSEDIRN